MKIGERIRKQREALGWSQEELAQKMGYTHRSALSKIEVGKNDVSYSKMLRFAEVLGTSVGYLVGVDER